MTGLWRCGSSMHVELHPHSHPHPHHEVRVLFKDHQDLLEEFAKFLPDPNADKVNHSRCVPLLWR